MSGGSILPDGLVRKSCCFITPRQSLLAFSANVADVGLAQNNNNNKNVWTTIAIVIYRPSEESQQRCLGALVLHTFYRFRNLFPLCGQTINLASVITILVKKRFINVSQRKREMCQDSSTSRTFTYVLKNKTWIGWHSKSLNCINTQKMFLHSRLDHEVWKLKKSPVRQCPLCLVLDWGLFVFVHTVTPFRLYLSLFYWRRHCRKLVLCFGNSSPVVKAWIKKGSGERVLMSP